MSSKTFLFAASLLLPVVANAVPYGVNIDPEGEEFAQVIVPSMKKARGLKGVVKLDGPGCTIASSDVNRRWDQVMVAEEVSWLERNYQWTYSPHGQYQTAVECCWREGARLIGWSPIGDSDRLASMCAFGMKPLKPVAFEKRRAIARSSNRMERSCDRHPEDCIKYHAPVAQH